jgi:acetylornithine/succinyldiaminopimelate/putrescine aminotransferase
MKKRFVVPPRGYLKDAPALCKAHDVLFVCEEGQEGLGRPGANLCYLRENRRSDLVALGTALPGVQQLSVAYSFLAKRLDRNVSPLRYDRG